MNSTAPITVPVGSAAMSSPLATGSMPSSAVTAAAYGTAMPSVTT